VDCPYTGWDFEIADAIAAFGLHAVLILGEAKVLSSSTRSNLVEVLAQSTVSVSCSEGDNFTLCGAGLGSDVLESPIHALLALHRLVNSQPRLQPLAAGEIIASGAWTTSFPIKPKQTWTTAFSGISMPGLNLSLI
jgi:2-keto-4-pentenoate hydratase